MTDQQQDGYDFAKGLLICVGKFAALGWLTILAITLFANWLAIGVDDSDRDAWHRSGLTIHTDAKTGVQYLSDGKGGLIVREHGKTADN